MTPVHQSGLLFVYICNKFEFAGIFISKLNIYTVFRDILSICQLHILLSRTAQICVELHTKKPCCTRRDGQAELTWVAGYIPRWFTHLQTVTHPSTNRARLVLSTVD